MKFWKVISIGLFVFSGVANATSAGDIALGKIVGIKYYDLSNAKLIKLYLNINDIKNADCVDRGRAYATITFSKHDEATVNRMLSMAMATQMAEKSVRLYSEGITCEVDFIGIQDSYY